MAQPDLQIGPDGRQSEAAEAIQRGVQRLLFAHGMACLFEVALANGRRADVMAVDKKGDVTIVEIKSSLADFRSDQKWPEYRDFCDRLYFAVQPDFPLEVLPEETGLILADRYGGEIVRDAPREPLNAARRKAVLIRVARCGAMRVMNAIDPEGFPFDRLG